MNEKTKSGDILGLGAVSEAIAPISKGLVDGAAAFLGRICLPAAEEFGLLLRDRVGAWRARNAARVAQHAQEKVEGRASTGVHAPPRLVAQIVEQGSWTDDDRVQKMWGGLLASACSSDGTDDSNIIFADLLTKMTSSEARLLTYLCANAEIRISEVGWLHAYALKLPLPILLSVAAVQDAQRLDRELEHLRYLGLVEGGFERGSIEAYVAPTPLGLQMFARCEGCRDNPADFFRPTPAPTITADAPPDVESVAAEVERSTTVLVVDDEPSIVRVLSTALLQAGYNALGAMTGGVAVRIATNEHVDVMITDLYMPDLRGDAVFDMICGRQPHLRTATLFITGDKSERARRLIAACNSPVLYKPFSFHDLIVAVKDLLASTRP